MAFGKTVLLLNPAAVAELLQGATGPVVRDLFVRGERVKQEAIRIAPRKTGNLAAHIVKRIGTAGGSPVVLVGVVNVDYAIWVHEGAQPHSFGPKNAPFLVFYWPKLGRTMYLKRVNHPGNKPNRFLVRALSAAADQ